MPRKGPRRRIASGVYDDPVGRAAVVKVGHVQRERRFPPHTSLGEIQAWQEQMRRDLGDDQPKTPRGTWGNDVLRYEQQIQYLASWRERRSELRAWTKAIGAATPRTRVTDARVRQIMGDWMTTGVAPKTVANRVQTLKKLYRTLDGTRRTPFDAITPPQSAKTPPVVLSAKVIEAVTRKLIAAERTGRLRSAKTRARFLIYATCGKRPCEIMRAQPADVDLTRRVWIARDAKGGTSPGLYLNDDMRAAWRIFVRANAWGPFETSSLARVLRTAGWPAGVRPYNLRHSTWITASERGADLSDIQAGAGHKRLETTRRHYVPVLDSRMESLSRLLDGRLKFVRRLARSAGTRRSRTKRVG